MIVESTVAVSAGLFSGSLALIAFGGDSFVELLSSYAVASYLRQIRREKNVEPGEDKRVEKITAFLLFALIPVIGLGALYSYFSRIEPEASPYGIAVAFGASVIMPLLWYEKQRIGKAISCLPLEIDAIESVTCFLMSIALLASLLVNYIWRISWVDYLATVVILVFVAKEAFEATKAIRGRDVD
jgi:divalent metal cation (Fe/Co/Zn/Cd) transporter